MRPMLACLALAAGLCMPFSNSARAADFKTWDDIQWQGVIRQGLDISCGAAALLTLMNQDLKDDETAFDESDEIAVTSLLLGNRLGAADNQETDIIGFSMLDLSEQAQKMGFKSRLVTFEENSLADFLKAGRPALVYVESDGFRHYVVVTGIDNGIVFISDPSAGRLKLSARRFAQIWRGQTALYVFRGEAPKLFSDSVPQDNKDSAWKEMLSSRL